MALGEPAAVREFTLFISSSSKLREVRERAERLVRVADLSVREHYPGISVQARRYEQAGARRLAEGEGANDHNLEAVRTSNAVLVLVTDEILGGTLEEMREALNAKKQIYLLVFEPPSPKDQDKRDRLEEQLEPFKVELLYRECPAPPDSEEGSMYLTKTIMDFVLASLLEVGAPGVSMHWEERGLL